MAAIEPRTVTIGARAALVRTAVEIDAPAVLQLLKVVAGETDHLSREPDEIRMTIEEEASFLRGRLDSATDLYLIAEVDGRIVGSGSLDGPTLRRFDHAKTLGMAVRRDFWGMGIGRALMQALVLWADSRGIVRISLEVLETNARAVRLYESFGFEREGRLRAHRRHGRTYVDSLIMSRIRT